MDSGPSFLFIYLLLGQQCAAVTKKWLPNTNYGNAANWDKGRVPCSSDNVLLDKGKQLAVSLRQSHTVKSLSLPENGEVIFYDGAELHFTERQDSDSNTAHFCKDSGDIHFVASVQDWYNPSNWQDDTLPASFSIVLHTDNVPCVHDTVIFPQNNSFLIKSSFPIKVAAVELFGQRQSSKSFRDFYASESGSLQFNLTGSTDITSMECQDQMGCACGNLKFADTICSHVKCRKPACSGAFKAEGSCCAMCGTLLKLNIGQDFNMDEYRDRLLSDSKIVHDGVSIATSKTESGFVQIVLTDQENGQKAQVAAHHLRERISSEKGFRVDGTEVVAQSSVKPIAAKKTGKPKSSLIVSLTVGLTILFLLLAVALFLIYRRIKKAQSRPFFAVVEPMWNNDLELDEIDDMQNVSARSHQLIGKSELSMENPLYDCTTDERE